MVMTISLKAICQCEGNFLHCAGPWKECVTISSITCHCYRFQGTFDNANGLAVSYTNMKDMMYSLALKLPVNTWL